MTIKELLGSVMIAISVFGCGNQTQNADEASSVIKSVQLEARTKLEIESEKQIEAQQADQRSLNYVAKQLNLSIELYPRSMLSEPVNDAGNELTSALAIIEAHSSCKNPELSVSFSIEACGALEDSYQAALKLVKVRAASGNQYAQSFLERSAL